MSTVRLKEKYGDHKPGAVISVPYGKGKELITLGIAEYPTGPAEVAKPAVPSVPKAEMDAALKRIKELEAENKELKAEVTAAVAEVAKLKKP